MGRADNSENPAPEGVPELSPALQRWGSLRNDSSPGGTTELSPLGPGTEPLLEPQILQLPIGERRKSVRRVGNLPLPRLQVCGSPARPEARPSAPPASSRER